MCVCVWCSGCVLGSGPEVPEFKPNSGQFSISFSICLLPAPPVHPAVIGYLAFAGVQIQGIFPCNSNGPGGTLGAHTTCCEERLVLLFLARLQELCLHGSQCLLNAQASWLCQVRVTTNVFVWPLQLWTIALRFLYLTLAKSSV